MITQKIHLTKEGFVRLADESDLIEIICTQEQYEKILGMAMFQECCVTPLGNFESYKSGDKLKDTDIPEKCDFDFPEVEVKFTEEDLLTFFIQMNKENVNEAFEEEIKDDNYFVNGKVIHCTLFDRFNLQQMVSQNRAFCLNGEYYNADELKEIYHTIENEITKTVFYKSVLLRMCDTLTQEDRQNNNCVEWGVYDDFVKEEMKKFEPPFN